MRNAIALLIAALALVAFMADPPPVSLKVRPHVLFAGKAIFLEARVAPRAENRWLRLDASPELAVSEISLAGEAGPRSLKRTWRVEAPGEYLIRATVYDGRSRVLGYASQRIVVADE